MKQEEESQLVFNISCNSIEWLTATLLQYNFKLLRNFSIYFFFFLAFIYVLQTRQNDVFFQNCHLFAFLFHIKETIKFISVTNVPSRIIFVFWVNHIITTHVIVLSVKINFFFFA